MKIISRICFVPYGLCANRNDHTPHLIIVSSLGSFWCKANQNHREPYRSELRRKIDKAERKFGDQN